MKSLTPQQIRYTDHGSIDFRHYEKIGMKARGRALRRFASNAVGGARHRSGVLVTAMILVFLPLLAG